VQTPYISAHANVNTPQRSDAQPLPELTLRYPGLVLLTAMLSLSDVVPQLHPIVPMSMCVWYSLHLRSSAICCLRFPALSPTPIFRNTTHILHHSTQNLTVITKYKTHGPYNSSLFCFFAIHSVSNARVFWLAANRIGKTPPIERSSGSIPCSNKTFTESVWTVSFPWHAHCNAL